MNFFESKKEISKSVNKEMMDALDKQFKDNYEELKQTLLANGAKPNEVDKILQEAKLDTQVELIKRFKEKIRLKELEEQNKLAARSQQSQNPQPAKRKRKHAAAASASSASAANNDEIDQDDGQLRADAKQTNETEHRAKKPNTSHAPNKTEANEEQKKLTEIANQTMAEALNTQIAEARNKLLAKGIKPEEVEKMLQNIKLRASAKLVVVVKEEIDRELRNILAEQQKPASTASMPATPRLSGV